MPLNQISDKWCLWNQKRHLKLQKPNWKANKNSKACSTYHNGTQIFTSRSKSPTTPSTSPAAPTNPMDSPNNKAASIATVKGWESIITCILENVVSQMQLKLVHGLETDFPCFSWLIALWAVLSCKNFISMIYLLTKTCVEGKIILDNIEQSSIKRRKRTKIQNLIINASFKGQEVKLWIPHIIREMFV